MKITISCDTPEGVKEIEIDLTQCPNWWNFYTKTRVDFLKIKNEAINVVYDYWHKTLPKKSWKTIEENHEHSIIKIEFGDFVL